MTGLEYEVSKHIENHTGKPRCHDSDKTSHHVCLDSNSKLTNTWTNDAVKHGGQIKQSFSDTNLSFTSKTTPNTSGSKWRRSKYKLTKPWFDIYPTWNSLNVTKTRVPPVVGFLRSS